VATRESSATGFLLGDFSGDFIGHFLHPGLFEDAASSIVDIITRAGVAACCEGVAEGLLLLLFVGVGDGGEDGC
jgi:hypothetical protein